MTQRDSTLTLVLDYAAMGRPSERPQRLHREECMHPQADRVWREATAQERDSLPECLDCLAIDGDAPLKTRRPENVAAIREQMRSGQRPRVRFRASSAASRSRPERPR